MRWSTLLPFLLLSLNVNAFFHNLFSASGFFNGIAKHIPLTGCAVRNLPLPTSSLPKPAPNLSLKHITLGRGTQNYTCESANSTTAPEAAGAVATLFDASCIASLDQSILHTLPDLLKRVPLSGADLVASIINRFMGQGVVIGKHYFNKAGQPFFDLRTSSRRGSENDWICAKKLAAVDAPAQAGYGETGDVSWLKLGALDGGIKEVYRVHTGGGDPPTTCLGMPETFTVDYMAEYWFYA